MLVLPFPAIDPALFTLDLGFVQFSLRWYALAYVAGLVLGWQIVAGLMRRPGLWGGNAPMAPAAAEGLLTWAVLGVILGGRLGYVLFYRPDYYLANPLEMLVLWEGGMSFHGGFLGVVLAVALWSRLNAVPMWRLGDAVALAAPPGIFFGRIANFINGELWGRPTDLPWAMVFPDPRAGGVPRHPSQLYEAVLEGALLFAVMLWLVRRGWLRHPGAMVGVFFTGYGLARTIVEGFRQGDAQYVTPSNPNGHIWRLGDSAESWGLTMGQILSLPMVAAGVLILLWALRPSRARA